VQNTSKVVSDITPILQVLTHENNPLKVKGLADNGIQVVQRKAHITGISPINLRYLDTKRHRMDHILDID